MFNYGWDWLTCTSYTDKMDWLYDVVSVADGAKSGYLQYKGLGGQAFNGSWFMGEALQDGCKHWIAYCSSQLAEIVRLTSPDLPRATRLDIQFTVPMPKGVDMLEVYRGLKDKSYGAFNRRGRYPKLGVIDSDTTTIYIGNRKKSERLFRIYEKFIDGVKHLRFEVEYKSKNEMANKAIGQCRLDAQLLGLLRAEWETLPSILQIELSFMGEGLASLQAGKVERTVTDAQSGNTYRWLIGALAVARKAEMNELQRQFLVTKLNELVIYLEYEK